MSSLALATGIAALIAVGFALIGEGLLGRRSRNLFAWNQSLLIGMGVCAAALFPFSLLWPGGALWCELGLMALATVVFLIRRLPAKPRGGESRVVVSEPREALKDPVALVLLASIGVVAVLFAALDLRYAYLWDGFQIWATRAQLLFVHGGLSREWFSSDAYDARLLSYPPLVPLYEALLCVARGEFDFDALKPIFLPFYLSLLLSTYAAVRTDASRRWALAVTLLLALLPGVSTRQSAGGYADMPQAACVAAVVAASLQPDPRVVGWRAPLPWLIGSLTTIKSEGMILAALACMAVLLFWSSEQPRRLRERLRREWGAAAVIGTFVALRIGYVRWLGVQDTTYGPLDAAHLRRVPGLFGRVAVLCLRQILDVDEWGFFWPAFLLACPVVFLRGTKRERCLSLATAAGLATYAGIFLFTNWEVALHVENSFSRLLVQLAPAAAVVIGAAGHRIWSERLGEGA